MTISSKLKQEVAKELLKMITPMQGCLHCNGYVTILWQGNPRLSIYVCTDLCGYHIPVDANAWKEMVASKRVRKTITLAPDDGAKLKKEGHD